MEACGASAGSEAAELRFQTGTDAAIGDGGMQIFHLVADAPGTFEVGFVLKRPWEDEAVLTRKFEVVAT